MKFATKKLILSLLLINISTTVLSSPWYESTVDKYLRSHCIKDAYRKNFILYRHFKNDLKENPFESYDPMFDYISMWYNACQKSYRTIVTETATIKSDKDKIKNQVITIEQDITNIRSSNATLKSQLGNLRTSNNQLSNTIKKITNNISNIETKINDTNNGFNINSTTSSKLSSNNKSLNTTLKNLENMKIKKQNALATHKRTNATVNSKWLNISNKKKLITDIVSNFYRNGDKTTGNLINQIKDASHKNELNKIHELYKKTQQCNKNIFINFNSINNLRKLHDKISKFKFTYSNKNSIIYNESSYKNYLEKTQNQIDLNNKNTLLLQHKLSLLESNQHHSIQINKQISDLTHSNNSCQLTNKHLITNQNTLNKSTNSLNNYISNYQSDIAKLKAREKQQRNLNNSLQTTLSKLSKLQATQEILNKKCQSKKITIQDISDKILSLYNLNCSTKNKRNRETINNINSNMKKCLLKSKNISIASELKNLTNKLNDKQKELDTTIKSNNTLAQRIANIKQLKRNTLCRNKKESVRAIADKILSLYHFNCKHENTKNKLTFKKTMSNIGKCILKSDNKLTSDELIKITQALKEKQSLLNSVIKTNGTLASKVTILKKMRLINDYNSIQTCSRKIKQHLDKDHRNYTRNRYVHNPVGLRKHCGDILSNIKRQDFDCSKTEIKNIIDQSRQYRFLCKKKINIINFVKRCSSKL